MESLDRSRFADAVVACASELKSSRHLQLGWGTSSVWLLTGTLLLFCRVLGNFTPDTDALRALGVILLSSGFVLTVSWGLLKSCEEQDGSSWEYLAWNGFLFAGSVAFTLAVLPVSSSLTVLSGIALLLVLGFFLADFTLSGLAINSGSLPSEIMPTEVDNTEGRLNPAELQLNETSSQEQLIQWLSRKQDAQGAEVVEGMIRLELAAGQIQKAAHIAFTPSFAHAPEMECEPLGDAEVEVILGDVYPHGFRLEIRRVDSNRDAMEVEVGFQAMCDSPSQNAA